MPQNIIEKKSMRIFASESAKSAANSAKAGLRLAEPPFFGYLVTLEAECREFKSEPAVETREPESPSLVAELRTSPVAMLAIYLRAQASEVMTVEKMDRLVPLKFDDEGDPAKVELGRQGLYTLRTHPRKGGLYACVPISAWFPRRDTCEQCRDPPFRRGRCVLLEEVESEQSYYQRRRDLRYYYVYGRWSRGGSSRMRLCRFHAVFRATGYALTYFEQLALEILDGAALKGEGP